MLKELRITNFAIIEHLELEFQGGLITFTGETGAGKSIILDAIEALVGSKTDVNSIRAEADRAQLEAVFQITQANQAGSADDPGTGKSAGGWRREFVTITRELGEKAVRWHVSMVNRSISAFCANWAANWWIFTGNLNTFPY